MGSKYFSEACDVLLDSANKDRKLLDNLIVSKNSIDLSYILGYEKALILKDEKSEKDNELISSFDSDKIVATFDYVKNLIEHLRKNKEDNYIKHKVIWELGELNNYFNQVINKHNESKGEVK